MIQVAELFLEEGRAEGRAEGSELEKEKIIFNMYKLGDPLDKIAKVTESDIDKVKWVINRNR